MKANTLVIYLLLFIFVGASVSQTPVGRYLYPMSVSSAQRDSLNLPGDGQVPMIYNSDTTRWEFTIDNGVNWRHIIDNSQSESSRTIAVFEIPIQFRIDGDGDGYRNGGYPVDFEFKIYKNSDYGDFDPSSELIDPAMWYSSRDSSNSSQVLPRGLPDGFYMGGPGSGVAGEQQKIVKVISHSDHDSIAGHEDIGFHFSSITIFVETQGTSYELLNDCVAMVLLRSASETDRISGGGMRWTSIQPSQWVGSLPSFLVNDQ